MTSTERATALLFRGVTKRFGDNVAVEGVDLEIADGEWVTLLGASGSGKTTLLRILAGFETATSGTVELQGQDVSRLTPAERNIGMVFQQYALFPHMTVAENIGYGLKMHGWNAAKRGKRIEEMLDIIRLPVYGNRYPGQLWGGQQQRIALARALAFGPRVLLMDEPLGALDRSLRIEMEQVFRRIHRELRPTVIYVTHDQEEALVLSDRIAILKNGRLIAFDTPRRLHDDPRKASVASFFSGADLLPATWSPQDGRALVEVFGVSRAIPRPAELGPDEPVALAVRPPTWRPGVVEDGWSVSGTIVDLSYLGDVMQLSIAIEPTGAWVTARMPVDEAPGVGVGDRMTIGVAAADARLVRDDRE